MGPDDGNSDATDCTRDEVRGVFREFGVIAKSVTVIPGCPFAYSSAGRSSIVPAPASVPAAELAATAENLATLPVQSGQHEVRSPVLAMRPHRSLAANGIGLMSRLGSDANSGVERCRARKLS